MLIAGATGAVPNSASLPTETTPALTCNPPPKRLPAPRFATGRIGPVRNKLPVLDFTIFRFAPLRYERTLLLAELSKVSVAMAVTTRVPVSMFVLPDQLLLLLFRITVPPPIRLAVPAPLNILADPAVIGALIVSVAPASGVVVEISASGTPLASADGPPESTN